MNLKRGGLLVTLGWLLATGSACAAEAELLRCRFPEPPRVPDGRAATEAGLAEAGAAVRQFVSGIDASIACIDNFEREQAAGLSADQREQLTAIRANGRAQAVTLAEAFNRERAIYYETCCDSNVLGSGGESAQPGQVPIVEDARMRGN
ncbi:MAG: hypothetical protein ACKOBM_14390 [Gammaproteobacteria bacterium]